VTPTTIRPDTARRHQDKYTNKNLLHKLALGRFHDALAAEIASLSPKSILDFGCGEGFLVERLRERGVAMPGYVGVDLRSEAVQLARERNPDMEFRTVDIFEWPRREVRFDLVIASEVLEHLYEPERYLERLVQVSSRALLLTVPHEPWFRLLNLMRGRDILRLGNHPEHVQHWNPESFTRFVRGYASVVAVRSAFPFVILTAGRD